MSKQCKMVANVLGSVARKVGESALHAAIFAYVSKRVSNMMTKQEEKEKAKLRVEDGIKTSVTSNADNVE